MTDIIAAKVIAWYQGQRIDRQTFSLHVMHVRQLLAQKQAQGSCSPKILNLCEDHYHFLVLFTAAMLQGLLTVLPSNRSDAELQRLRQLAAALIEMDDAMMHALCANHSAPATVNPWQWSPQHIPTTQIVAELYTSGTTGTPVANAKTWGQLVVGAQQVLARFGLSHRETHYMVATVPPQHMFGFEMGIMLPLVGDVAVYHLHPFYPLDIQQALQQIDGPRILVTTPLHLKSCTTLTMGWPAVEFIISATAPLTSALAKQVESLLQTAVREIYGCSEAGAIATRRVCRDERWKLLSAYQIAIDDSAPKLHIPGLCKTITLPDYLQVDDGGYFKLIGRNADLIKIGGKRGSLADITTRLKSISGVEDAVVFVPECDAATRLRLAALVVAPGVTADFLRQQLLRQIDPVFLPRPLCVIEALPYNRIGKLLKSDLLACLQQFSMEGEA